MKNKLSILIGLLLVSVMACQEDVTKRFFEDDEPTITSYLNDLQEDYSMFIELLDRAGFKQAFNAYGSYTLFAFQNDGFQTYLNANGYQKVTDLSVEEAKILVRYHTLKSIIPSISLGLGKLPAKNLEDDELVSSFDETGLQGIIINRESKVIIRDITLSNGIIHVLDKTMTPLVKSVAQRMEDTGEYVLFIEAAKATGLYDYLNRNYDTISPTNIKREYFTVFAESDLVFLEDTIADLNALKAKYNNGINDPKNPEDSLYKFIANHIINEKAIFTKDILIGNYQTFAGELINFFIDQQFKINLLPNDETSYVSFLDGKVDNQAKNGVFHGIDKVLDIYAPEPVEVIWDFLDFPYGQTLLALGKRDTETEVNLLNFNPVFTGSISGIFCHHPGINNEPYGFLNGDALILAAPSWDFTVHMPVKVVKGRYKLFLSVKGGSGRATVQMLIDGTPVGEPVNTNGNRVYWQQELFVDQVTLPETKSYDVRFVTVVNGQGQLDYIRFEPI
ncbi:MAG: fasciclin domain-containing protein [Bacteroidales bacterium]|nr:fasciclin domain-containing protein [Bacteroidales bacterium]MCF8389888.1 fasciclin domain-containing protein [Bacteroidales bacterium]